MAGGFSVGVAADTRAFESGVKKGIIDPVEDAQDKLEQLGKAGDKAGDGLDRGLRESEMSLGKLGRAGKEAGDDLEDGLKGAQKQTRLTADDYRAMTQRIESETAKIKRSSKEAADSSGEAFKTVKQEALSNASETFSSFDGSAQSFADGLQGIFGGVVTDLGPVGAAIGAAGALAVGAISTMMGNAEENTEEFKARVQAASDDLVQTFLGDYEAGSRLDEAFRDWVQNSDRYGISLSDLQKDLRNTGLSFKSVATVIAGQSTPALRDTRKEIEKHIDALRRQAAVYDTTAGADNTAARAAGRRADILQKDVVPAINQNIKANESARVAEEALAAAQGKTVKQYERQQEAASQAREAAESYADGVQGAYAEAGSAIDDYVEDGVFNLGRYAEATQKNLDAIVGYQRNMSEAQGILAQEGHDTAIQYLEQLGPDAAPLIAAFVNAPLDQQQNLARIWDQLGATSASSFGTKLQSDLDATAITKNVLIQADTSAYDAAVRAITGHSIQQNVDLFVNNPQNRYVAPRRDVP